MVFFVAVWAVASLVLPKATAKTRVNRFLVETLLEKEFASYSLICNLLKSMKRPMNLYVIVTSTIYYY